MQLVEFSHKSGDSVIGSNLIGRIRRSLQATNFIPCPRSAPQLRKVILENLIIDGWSGQVQISTRRRLTITAMQKNVGLCLQTGNMARFYADILKLQSLFLEESIYGAIYLLPTKSAARAMGQNLANYERLIAELSEEFYRVITIPMHVIGFESGETQS